VAVPRAGDDCAALLDVAGVDVGAFRRRLAGMLDGGRETGQKADKLGLTTR
jgi:hypothetical protein